MAAVPVHVAVGVIVNDRQQVLLALRPQQSHQGGLWECPGGKVEAGEAVPQALVRELEEELAITAQSFRPLLEVRHDYQDKAVLLDVWWVDNFAGQPFGCEGQVIRWVDVAKLATYDFPVANQTIVTAVQAEFCKA